MKPTLVIMAAGMGSRYGGLKQIDSVGPHGERIIDYSMADAIESGFGKIVFIIRKEFEAAFRSAIEPGISGRIPFEYVFQDVHKVPSEINVSATRTKPWGTGHAILCCREMVSEPFGVINADDFYGRDAFFRLADGLTTGSIDRTPYILVGYKLINTMSPFGSVSRGVCHMEERGFLTGITEKTKIQFDSGCIVSLERDGSFPLPPETIVSMNMWGFSPEIFGELESAFAKFLLNSGHDDKVEFFIPSVIDSVIKTGKTEVKVTLTAARWMGMTHPEDRDAVRAGISSLIQAGEYPSPLW